MGLFDWLKPKTRTHGPTPEGLYGGLPKRARWVGGADPAGDPESFIPGPEAYVFDIAEWRWDKHLWIEATTNSAGSLAGFGLLLGFGLHFPKLDADIYLPALLEGILGSRNWVAAHLGALGGRAKSRAKAAASRRNGRLGGRPKKKTAA